MKWLILIILVLLTCRMAGEIQAHSAGQQPNFKINGVYSDLYPVPSANLTDFGIPQDLATGVYKVNQKINFEIDLQVLGVAKDQIKNTQFDWYFGDGYRGKGIVQSHTYSRTGSYILTIMVGSPELPTAQLFQSVLINVIDGKSSTIPQAKIKVNGQVIQSSLETVYADLNRPVEVELVDADKFASVSWNFADGTQTVMGDKVRHIYPVDKYPGGLSIVSATVRAKTADGFIADNYVQIYDISLKVSPTPSTLINNIPSRSSNIKQSRLIVGGLVLIFVFGGIVLGQKVTKNR
jgi:hypothetical protein